MKVENLCFFHRSCDGRGTVACRDLQFLVYCGDKVTTTSPMLQPAGTLRGGGASRGDARWHDGSAIVVGKGCNSAMDGGMAAQLR
jgi:hypothetical protein